MQTELFAGLISVKFKPAELESLRKPWKSDFGAVHFLEMLLERIDRHGQAHFTETELQKCYHFGYEISNGGPQSRFRTIVAAARRAGWEAK